MTLLVGQDALDMCLARIADCKSREADATSLFYEARSVFLDADSTEAKTTALEDLGLASRRLRQAVRSRARAELRHDEHDHIERSESIATQEPPPPYPDRIWELFEDIRVEGLTVACPHCGDHDLRVESVNAESCDRAERSAHSKYKHSADIVYDRNRDRFQRWLGARRDEGYAYIVRGQSDNPARAAFLHTIDCPVLKRVASIRLYSALTAKPDGLRSCRICFGWTS